MELMGHTFTVTVDGQLSKRDAEKLRKALHKATAPWFKDGHDVTVDVE